MEMGVTFRGHGADHLMSREDFAQILLIIDPAGGLSWLPIVEQPAGLGTS